MNHDCNMLIDYLPETVEIEGVEYEIESNFRTFILFEMLMQDSELSDSEKAMQGLKLAYPVIPDNLEAAVDELLWFYACGKRWREKRAGSVEGASEVQRIYSFEHDDDYIYSAFLTQYHIDLQDIKYLHWWKFKALLRTLSSDLEFSESYFWEPFTLPSSRRSFTPSNHLSITFIIASSVTNIWSHLGNNPLAWLTTYFNFCLP